MTHEFEHTTWDPFGEPINGMRRAVWQWHFWYHQECFNRNGNCLSLHWNHVGRREHKVYNCTWEQKVMSAQHGREWIVPSIIYQQRQQWACAPKSHSSSDLCLQGLVLPGGGRLISPPLPNRKQRERRQALRHLPLSLMELMWALICRHLVFPI